MNQFDTPEWGEDLKEERWTSGLFEQSNAKVKDTKIRKRNKYPKGFAKSEVSSESKKANSSASLKSPKPELLNKIPNDQKVTQTSKKKRKKTKTGGSEVSEHDAGEPPSKTQKTAGQVSAISLSAHENEKKAKKQKAPVESRNGQEAGEKAAESNKSSKSEDSCNAVRRKRKKNKGLSDTCSDVNEQPAKVKKLTENSTVKDELCASSANESVPLVTPKKRKRNRKKKKNTSLETSEDKTPVESSAQESTPKLSASKRRRARKKREMERKAEENPNFKGGKKRKRRRTSQKSEGEATPNNENLHVEGAKEIDDETIEKNLEGSEKSDKKRKKKRKSLEDAVSKGDQSIGNDSSSKLNESLEILGTSESPAKSKSKKKKKKVEEENISEVYTSPSAEIDVKLVNDEKEDVDVLEEPSNVKEEHGSNVDNSKGTKKKGLSLREKMEEKLKGARFRFLNEQLYNSKSGDTSKYFLIEQDAFKAYHEGYKQQLNQWPVKPIDLIIRALKKKPANLVIADFGCGDAQLSKALPNKVYSFDHVALNDRVTACDMAKTPLSKGSVDIVVFCLSLMGSNLSDYIAEANRVMKMGGLMKIAEVESRFEDVSKFLQLMGKFGFLCTCKDLSNDYFYLFDFRKEKNIKEGKMLPSLELRACSYKKR